MGRHWPWESGWMFKLHVLHAHKQADTNLFFMYTAENNLAGRVAAVRDPLTPRLHSSQSRTLFAVLGKLRMEWGRKTRTEENYFRGSSFAKKPCKCGLTIGIRKDFLNCCRSCSWCCSSTKNILANRPTAAAKCIKDYNTTRTFPWPSTRASKMPILYDREGATGCLHVWFWLLRPPPPGLSNIEGS